MSHQRTISNAIWATFDKSVCVIVNRKYTEPQKKRRNFNNSIRYGKQSIYFFSLSYKFLLKQDVGTHHKKLSNNKLLLHKNFIITHIDNFIV